MVKTLAVCAALGIAAIAVPRFSASVAGRPAPARAFATDAGRVVVHHATAAEPERAPLPNDGSAERQVADTPPIVVLGVAHAGWSDLFNH
ncbi:hypothetical protein [Burkholderia pseudomultivorans]|uniref:hypothetical protein n=1 Tax=Burkholderia pseudomultivorans TaxID=1207504 RepID=UPI0007534C9D|nr:hypothetical protein [Burkholderia pseudomultivorans]KVC24756.1 hypothetical protein WS55_01885 [Burkholderia pseudomultivorans]KVC31245.1 hypothetical protein WS56_17300 [Burkholderia pseudomultivorans]